MKLHCLGTAGYHPNESRQTSCYFVPERSLMFDAGTGLFRASSLLQNDSLVVLLSHAHLDHVVGLTFFLELIATTPLQNIHVYGERTKLKAIQDHLFSELIFPVLPAFQWHCLEDHGNRFALAGGELSWFPLKHPGGSVGYRIDWPEHSLAYVTDTTCTPESEYLHAIRGVDTLVHECNFCDGQEIFARKTGHSWTSEVVCQAARAQVKRLVLTHIDPLSIGEDPVGLLASQAKASFASPKDLVVASDGLVLDLGRL